MGTRWHREGTGASPGRPFYPPPAAPYPPPAAGSSRPASWRRRRRRSRGRGRRHRLRAAAARGEAGSGAPRRPEVSPPREAERAEVARRWFIVKGKVTNKGETAPKRSAGGSWGGDGAGTGPHMATGGPKRDQGPWLSLMVVVPCHGCPSWLSLVTVVPQQPLRSPHGCLLSWLSLMGHVSCHGCPSWLSLVTVVPQPPPRSQTSRVLCEAVSRRRPAGAKRQRWTASSWPP